MGERPRVLPSWLPNQSVSSSTSAVNNAGSSANENNEAKVSVADPECSNGNEIPTSSGAAGPLRVIFMRDDAVDSCRESGSSDSDGQVVSGTSDECVRNTVGGQDELVHSTSDGAATGSDEPDSSHNVATTNDDGNGEVESSGLNSNQDEVSSAQPTRPRESCFYGSSCYRNNPQHRQDFSHPGNADYVESSSNLPVVLPVCKYGQGCFRRNPKHRREYNHDVAPTARAARPTTLRDGDSSTDEDFDSGSSDDFNPGSESDDSFVVSDSYESGNDSEYSPNKDAHQRGGGTSKKQSKRNRKNVDRPNKKNKN